MGVADFIHQGPLLCLETFGCHSLEEVTGTQWVETRDAIKHLQCSRCVQAKDLMHLPAKIIQSKMSILLRLTNSYLILSVRRQSEIRKKEGVAFQ